MTQSLLAYIGSMLRRVIVRNRSAGGMMIEIDDVKSGEAVVIELPSGQLVKGTVRWTKLGRAGVELSVVAQVNYPFRFEPVDALRARHQPAAEPGPAEAAGPRGYADR